MNGGGSNVYTMPAATGTLMSRDSTDTVSNKGFSTSTNTLTNPYKFRAYLAAVSQSISTTPVAIHFETRSYDSNSNVDITINKGRYTAPINGYYFFVGRLRGSPAAANGYIRAQLYVNGSSYAAGQIARIGSSAGTSTSSIVTDLIPLSAGDYVEVYGDADSATAVTGVNAFDTYFTGYFVCAS